jgi:hypothetical protein
MRSRCTSRAVIALLTASISKTASAASVLAWARVRRCYVRRDYSHLDREGSGTGDAQGNHQGITQSRCRTWSGTPVPGLGIRVCAHGPGDLSKADSLACLGTGSEPLRPAP